MGCQYGLLVFWDLKMVLESDSTWLDFNHKSCLKVSNEHSGAISHIHIDENELITDDYDGVVIVRNLRKHSEIRNIF